MALTGQAKKDYQRQYMRARRRDEKESKRSNDALNGYNNHTKEEKPLKVEIRVKTIGEN